MFRNIPVVILIIYFLCSDSLAQIGAVINGHIRDTQTGAPVPGITVSLNLRSAQIDTDTDSSGFFNFTGIEDGMHRIYITLRGHAPVILKEISIQPDNFTVIDVMIDRSGDTLKFSHTVKDFENFTVYSMDRKSLDETALRNFGDYTDLFPSAWLQDDRLHIRAGRSDETAYYIDGMPLSDPLDNSFAGYIIPEAIESISILSGGYPARYGLASSGLVMTRLRRGTSDLNFSLDLHTDKFADEGEKFLNTYSYQDRYIIAQASGPLYWERLRFYAAYENSDIGDAAKRFSRGFYFPNLVDHNPSSVSVNPGYPDTLTLAYPDGFTPDNSASRWALNATFSLDLHPVQIELVTLVDHQKVYDSRIPMLDMLNTRKFHTESSRLLIQGGLTHRLGPSSVYSVTLAHFSRESERFDDITGKNWLAWSDTALMQQLTGRRFRFEDNSYPLNDQYWFGGIQFSRDGIITGDYRHQKQYYFTLTASITHQIGRGHNLLAGIDWRRYTLRYYQMSPTAGWYLRNGQFGSDPEDYLANYLTNLYGYDLYGNESDEGLNGPREPSFFSAHIEDRIRYKDVLFSFGLRLDRFNNDDRVLVNPSDPQISSDWRGIADNAWQEQDPMWYLSPRFGLALSAGSTTTLSANVSRLVQPPPLRNSYYATYIYDWQIFRGGFFYYQPIGFDLTAIKTKTIDLGIRQKITSAAELSATAFYKHTTGQIQVQRQYVPQTSSIFTYFYMTNQGTSEVRGFDLSFRSKRTKRIQTFFNYTYTNARGTASKEDDYYATLYRTSWYDTTRHNYNSLYPLNFVPVHKVNLDIDYRFAANEGGPVFRNFGINLLLRADSGHPYTKTYVPPGG